MSLSRSPENTQIRVNAALYMIDQAANPLKGRFAVAYAIGYIDALHDERLISIDGAELYRQGAYARRRERLAVFGVALGSDESQPSSGSPTMTEHNDPQALADIRQKIQAMAACESLALVQYDYAYLDGWIGALYWANVIDKNACEGLRAETLVALKAWVKVAGTGN